MDAEETRQFLAEDMDEQEAATLQPLLTELAQWDGPVPTEAETERLLTVLLPHLPQQSFIQHWRTRLVAWWPWQMLRAQMRIVRSEIWAASTLVMVLGVFVSFVLAQEGNAGAPLVLLAPLVAATGIAFLYNPADERIWELERVTAVSPRLLLLVRLLLVFGYDLLLSVLGSLILALLLPDLTLWALVIRWLAPMTFLAALALLLTILTGFPELGMLVSMGIWTMQQIRTMGNLGVLVYFLPDLTAVSTQPWLFVTAVLLLIIALWYSDRSERWL